MKKIVVFVVIAILSLAILSGCKQAGASSPPPEPKYEDFNSPEDMLDNPVVIEAIAESGFDYTLRHEPPSSPQALDSIEGVYNATGQVNDSDVSRVIGQRISSEILLFDQTTQGEIDYVERIGNDISLSAWGSFIRGSGTEFTLYIEGENTIRGITLYNVTMISGDIYPNGNVTAEGITTNVRKENAEGYLVPKWYTFNVAMTLQPVPSPSNLSYDLYYPGGSNRIVKLSWDRVDYGEITGYTVYRDGMFHQFVYDSASEVYINEQSGQTHSYYIVSVGLDGETESQPSNTVTVNTN